MEVLKSLAAMPLALGCMVYGTPAAPADWITLLSTPQVKADLDTASVKVAGSGALIHAWVRTTYANPQPYEGQQVSMLMAQYEVECPSRRYFTIDGALYNSNGEVIVRKTANPAALTPQEPIPESMADIITTTLCESISKVLGPVPAR